MNPEQTYAPKAAEPSLPYRDTDPGADEVEDVPRRDTVPSLRPEDGAQGVVLELHVELEDDMKDVADRPAAVLAAVWQCLREQNWHPKRLTVRKPGCEPLER